MENRDDRKDFSFPRLYFGWEMEKWRNGEYSLYKFTHMPLLDKESNKLYFY